MVLSSRILVHLRQRTLKKVDKLLKYTAMNEVKISSERCAVTLQQPVLEMNLICDGIVRSPFPDIITPNITLEQFIWENLDLWPNHIAIECGVSGRKYTFSKLRTLSRRFAESLRQQGLCPGNVLSVMLPNIPEYPIILLGALEAGLIVSPINPIYTPYELSHQLHDNDSSAIVTLPDLAKKLNEAKQEIESKTNKPFTLHTIFVNYDSVALPTSTIDFKDMVSDCVQISDLRPIRQPNDIALLPYSSGTTGLSKGVQLTHRNLISNILQAEEPQLGYLQSTTKDFQEVLPGVLPFFHIYGLMIIMLRGVYKGCKVVTLPKFEAVSFTTLLKNHQASILYAVPPIILFLGNHPMVSSEHLASLRYIVNGAGPVSAADRDKIIEKSNGNFLFTQGYGLTEMSPLVFGSPVYKADFSFLVPIKSTLAKIVKEDGTLASPNENGEICVRGPQVMKGYHNRPDATKECIDENGYFHTGDIGYYTEEGGFKIVDRLKELIKVQGFQVAPAELEAILRTHPQVEDVAVIGIPDERTGEKPLAFVIKKTNTNGNVKNEDLQNYVASKVAPFKRLSGVVFVNSIPKNSSGKILRRIIKAEYLSRR